MHPIASDHASGVISCGRWRALPREVGEFDDDDERCG